MILREDDERPCPPVIRDVLVGKEGWQLFVEEGDDGKKKPQQQPFNLFWKTNRFYPSQIDQCVYPYQRCNHYPKSAEITKKDGLYRHMKRMRVTHGATLYNFFPETFTLPNDYVKFCQYFAAEREKVPTGQRLPLYICKPSDLSRGRKIFVFDDIGELNYDCSSVVQRYIERPLLIHGHKVDFRVYVLVTSFQPLRIYLYDDFLTRFGGEAYTTESKNSFVHLTNYSVTKTSTSDALVRAGVGTTCKWDGKRTREYFAKCGVDFSLMWGRIQTLVCCTILSIFHLVPAKPQCFELYGFDILYDDQLQPWLLEANFSPALAVDNEVDVKVKHALIRDLVRTLHIPALPQEMVHQCGSETGDESTGGGDGGGATPHPLTSQPKQARAPSDRPLRDRPPPASGGCRDRSRSVSQTCEPLPPPLPQQQKSAAPPRTSRPVVSPALPLSKRANSSSNLQQRRQPRLSQGVQMPTQASEGAAAAAAVAAKRTALVDSPEGGMRLIFPFNEETERLSFSAAQSGQLETSLKSMLAEVRRRDSKCSALRDLAALYAEKSCGGSSEPR